MSVTRLNAMLFRMSQEAGYAITLENCLLGLIPMYPNEIKREDLYRKFAAKYGSFYDTDSIRGAINSKLTHMVKNHVIIKTDYGIYSRK